MMKGKEAEKKQKKKKNRREKKAEEEEQKREKTHFSCLILTVFSTNFQRVCFEKL